MKTNTRIALLVSLMINAVLFGVGAITVLSIPSLNERAIYLLPAVIVASFALSPFLSRTLAPRMRSQAWQEREKIETERLQR